jgi:hypothetical protein
MATGEEDYEAIYQYLRCGVYPAGVTEKNSRRNFRRKANDNYMIKHGHLYYHKKGGKEWRKVPQTRKERERVLESCHTDLGGMCSNVLAIMLELFIELSSMHS